MSNNSSEMTFLEHLEELRWRIIKSVIAISVFAVLAFSFKNILFDIILLAPRTPEFITNRWLCKLGDILHADQLCINLHSFKLVSINMSGQFSTHLTISIIAGIILASPYVFWQFWNFIAPALHSEERKHVRGAVFIISALFLIGILFGYYLISPFSVDFLGNYSVSNQIENTINLTSYFATVASVTLASGIVFELPILAYYLAKIGIITPGFMRRYRRHAIVVILIIAAIITPPDMFSQILVSIPLILLYEISIFIVAFVVRKKQAA
jgi:sec-independent protein translocase protein TatC